MFYEQEAGAEIVIFDDGDGHIVDRGYDRRPLPTWANQFVIAIDGDENGQITAARAIEVLTTGEG